MQTQRNNGDVNKVQALTSVWAEAGSLFNTVRNVMMCQDKLAGLGFPMAKQLWKNKIV